MSAKDIDFSSLGFAYIKTDYRYVSEYKDGKWDEGKLVTDEKVVLNESAGILQYCQECFEGLKAYRTKDNKIVTFRPDMNAKRMYKSALRLEMPAISEEKFLEAIDMVVKANADFVPPFSSGASLYIRPFMFASGIVIGVKPALEYQFRVFATPVGPYFKGGKRLLNITVSDFDRAAPNGTGDIKAGLNYAMSLHPLMEAHRKGFDENMYLDPATRTYIEEAGGANYIFISKDNKFITPNSSSILPSITRNSLLYVAKNYLGLEVEERAVKLSELENMKEVGLCGTAAVISPVGTITTKDKVYDFSKSAEAGDSILDKLYDTLLKIQLGEIEAPEGWIREVEV